MSIFVLVAGLVYGAYKATFVVVHSSEYQAATADRSGFVLTRLTEDLQSLTLGAGGYFLGEEQSFAGARMDTLAFLSSAHVVLGKTDVPQGLVLIKYLSEVDNRNGLLSLYRAEMMVFPGVALSEGEAKKYLICSGLKEVRFLYHDTAGIVSTAWKNDDTNTTERREVPPIPAMVGVELVFPESTGGKKVQIFTTLIALPQQRNR